MDPAGAYAASVLRRALGAEGNVPADWSAELHRLLAEREVDLDPVLRQEVSGPVERVPIQLEPALANEEGDLPERDRADQDPVGLVDPRTSGPGQPIAPCLPPQHDVGVEEDQASASHRPPVEK